MTPLLRFSSANVEVTLCPQPMWCHFPSRAALASAFTGMVEAVTCRGPQEGTQGQAKLTDGTLWGAGVRCL